MSRSVGRTSSRVSPEAANSSFSQDHKRKHNHDPHEQRLGSSRRSRSCHADGWKRSRRKVNVRHSSGNVEMRRSNSLDSIPEIDFTCVLRGGCYLESRELTEELESEKDSGNVNDGIGMPGHVESDGAHLQSKRSSKATNSSVRLYSSESSACRREDYHSDEPCYHSAPNLLESMWADEAHLANEHSEPVSPSYFRRMAHRVRDKLYKVAHWSPKRSQSLSRLQHEVDNAIMAKHLR